MKKIFIFLILLFGLFFNQNSFASFSNLGSYQYVNDVAVDNSFINGSNYYYLGQYYYNGEVRYVFFKEDNGLYIKITDGFNNILNSFSSNFNSISMVINRISNYSILSSSKYFYLKYTINDSGGNHLTQFIIINKQNNNIGSNESFNASSKLYVPSIFNSDRLYYGYDGTDTKFYDLSLLGSNNVDYYSTKYIKVSGDIYNINSNKLDFYSCDYSYVLNNGKVLCSNGTDIVQRYYYDSDFNEFQEDYIININPNNYFFKGFQLQGDNAVYGVNQDTYLLNTNSTGVLQKVGTGGFLNFITGSLNSQTYYSIPGSQSGTYFDYSYLSEGGYIYPMAGLFYSNGKLNYSYFKSSGTGKVDFLLEGGDVVNNSSGALIIYSTSSDISNNNSLTGTTLPQGSINDINSLSNNSLINGVKDLFNISLPNTPNLSITLPIPILTNTFSIGYEEKEATLPPINDVLNKNSVPKNDISSKMFSFLFGLLYIGVRISIILGVLYVFKLYHNLVNKISSYLFGFNENSIGGNWASLLLYLTYLTIVFGTFVLLFSSIVGFFPIIQVITNFITVFFTFIVVSFFDYGIFQNTVNVFFALTIAGIVSYLLYVLTLKFGRLN